jgi:hypothetical protein
VSAQFLRGLAHVDGIAAIAEAGTAADDREVAKTRDRRHDILGDAVAEPVLAWLFRQGREGQHRDGEPGIRDGRRPSKPASGRNGGRGHQYDERHCGGDG